MGAERSSVVVLKPLDNVATALGEISPGTVVRFAGDARTGAVTALDRIPVGHKIALEPIPAGGPVYKYGEVMGRATVPIEAGRHVHIQNVESLRGRGDRVGREGGPG